MTDTPERRGPTRRDFLISSAAVVGTSALGLRAASRPSTDTLRVGLIGCGGRGRGAATQALKTDGPVELVAMADVFPDRLAESLNILQNLKNDNAVASTRVKVDPEHQFVGFDAYQKLLATDVDVVLLATPPHFRPEHFRAAIAAGKHVFMEKPVAVDGAGVQLVLETARQAKEKRLAVVSGLQRHHQTGYVELMKRVHDGAIGDIVAARCYWNQHGLWMKPRQDSWSDMEWQLRNWLYFTWLSGDHIVEQHVHNLDVINWAKRAHPVRAMGMGGRETRTDPAYGHIFDHHSVHYEYADGSFMFSQCRQQKGCKRQVSEHLIGTKGTADMQRGFHIHGDNAWKFEGPGNRPYQAEHDDLFASIRNGEPLNEGQYVAESTLTAIMGRMATYTGKLVTWEEAMASRWPSPEQYAFGDLPTPPVPTPGLG